MVSSHLIGYYKLYDVEFHTIILLSILYYCGTTGKYTFSMLCGSSERSSVNDKYQVTIIVVTITTVYLTPQYLSTLAQLLDRHFFHKKYNYNFFLVHT